ncbi:MAG TPA: hypothetical protein VI278_15740, partial [Nitrososphaeraceae archaeon]
MYAVYLFLQFLRTYTGFWQELSISAWSTRSNELQCYKFTKHTKYTSKKVHVGDIDIAYKTFGKGDSFLLISGAGGTMDSWDPSTLRDLSLNYTVIIFD